MSNPLARRPPRIELLRRGRKILELFVIPGLAALLPWPLSRRLLFRIARWTWLYRREVEAATEHAARAGFAPDRSWFAHRLRWRILVDHMDCYLAPLRGAGYLRRYVRASGASLPPSGGVVLIGSHHGCGYFLLLWAASLGRPLEFVVPRLAPVMRSPSPIENLYVRLRYRLGQIAAGRPLIHHGRAAQQIVSLLRQGRTTMALCDLPTARADAVEVELAGCKARLAPNMFRLAAKAGAQVLLYAGDTDLDTGLRTIELRPMQADTPADQVREYARFLDASIRRDPSGWRFWSIAPQLLDLPEQKPD